MAWNDRRMAGAAAALTLVLAACAVETTGESPAATTARTEPPTPTAEPTLPEPDDWPVQVSEQYGFTIGHPPGWENLPATRDWQLDTDASVFLGTAEERFRDPAGGIALSAWTVDLEGFIAETGQLVQWATEYCEAIGDHPCDGIEERAIPLCIELRDCHPALLVPFASDVFAYLPWMVDDHMVVVAVWRGDTHPTAAPYGGSVQLMLDTLRTMGDICPEADRSTCDGIP